MTQFSIAIILGLIPSIIWLLFYLRKDKRPEPNRMVILVFILGMLITLPAAIVEMGFKNITDSLRLVPELYTISYFIIGVGVTEELFKYLVVRFSVLRSKEFDEPVDAMIYMIIAGLGFAAVENILILWSLKAPYLIEQTTIALIGRFLGATFLHALACANIGFFIALSYFRVRKKKLLFIAGLLSSAVLHGAYNLGITMEGGIGLIIVGVVLLSLCILVLAEFHEIKKLRSFCGLRASYKKLNKKHGNL